VEGESMVVGKNNDHWTKDEFRRIVHPENNDHWT
jgi:hypothetical protein